MLARLIAFHDLIGDIRSVEAGGENTRAAECQPLDHIVARMGIRGGGKRNARHAGKALGEAAETAIFRAEVMSPLRYAMVLADRPLIFVQFAFVISELSEEQLLSIFASFKSCR